jgi:hypothetical protein
MTYWTWLPVFLGLTVVCSAKEIEPFAGPKPIAVLLQESPWATVMGAETPRLVVYENGDVIYSRQGPGPKEETYFYAELGFPALSDVISHLKPVVDLKTLKPMYSLPDDTNQGATLFYLFVDNKETVTSVYGLNPSDDREGFRVRTVGKIPDELRELYHYLLTVDFTESRPWRPGFVEAMLWPFEGAPDKVVPWPKSWPDLSSDRAIKRKNGFSIFLDGSMRDDLKQFLSFENEKDAVEINGKDWSVASRPAFPSEPVWRKAFSKIDEN